MASLIALRSYKTVDGLTNSTQVLQDCALLLALRSYKTVDGLTTST